LEQRSDPNRHGLNQFSESVNQPSNYQANNQGKGREVGSGMNLDTPNTPEFNRSINRDASQVARLQNRVGVLLGLRSDRAWSLTRAFADAGLELLDDASAYPDGRPVESPDLLEPVDLSYLEERFRYSFQPVPPLATQPEPDPAAPSDQERRVRLCNEIEYLRDGTISNSILSQGIFLDRYRVAARDEGDGYPVLFRRDQRELWWRIAAYPTQPEAIAAVNELRRLLIQLSLDSEGLHLVEHLLLRPRGSRYGDAPGDPEARRDFYSFRLSVFLPNWTARFSDPGFRQLAESVVRENCPAHVHPRFHWLDFPQMRRLEDLLQTWLGTRSQSDASQDEIDADALALTTFINSSGIKSSGATTPDCVGETS